jgi:hypothetical protein
VLLIKEESSACAELAVGILDALNIETADIVGHDWGAAVAWFTASLHPNRVRKLVVLSVPHPLAPATLRQREMAWYQLFFQFEGIAEAMIEPATLGIWSTNDHFLDGERVKMSSRFVKGPWRYEQIDSASHRILLDASDRLNQLLIEWLG